MVKPLKIISQVSSQHSYRVHSNLTKIGFKELTGINMEGERDRVKAAEEHGEIQGGKAQLSEEVKVVGARNIPCFHSLSYDIF